ncbi:MAG: PAS domain S-box protein [Bacteroidetes bacterium]|nr:PAS domain S-box protein [Bacteroidota bacterium]
MTKTIQKILSLIPHSIRDPFFILESSGKILFTNKQGFNLLNITEPQSSIMEDFESDSKEKFNELLDKAVEKNDTLTLDHFEFNLSSGRKVNAQIILNTLESGGNLFIFCTIIPKNYDITFTGKSKIKISETDSQSIIKSEKLIEIINKVEALYPITFIGKEIIHKLADELEDIFWITDDKGNFLLVNEYLAKNIGLKPFQIEGKPADEFVPGFLKELNLFIDKFIRDTMNCVISEGVHFRENENLKNKEIIQLPLFDEENNIQAVIGFSQYSESDMEQKTDEKLFGVLYKIIDYFPKPVAFITSQGIIKHSSEDFCKLFDRKPEDLNGLNFVDILPGSLLESVNRFLESPDNDRTLPLNRFLEIDKDGEPEYTVNLTKIFGRENEPEGFLILIEKVEYAENLQHLIKSRGRMFEFLIQNNPEPIYIYDKENLRFLEINKAALELYGYSREEFLEMDLTDLYNPEDIQSLLGSSSEGEIEGKFSKPFRHKRKDGSSVFVELSKMSFKFNDRDAHFNIVRDVTQNLELEKKNQLFKAVFDNTVDMIFVTDPDGIITYINSSVVNILGTSKLDLENSSMASLANDEDRATINTSIFQSHLKESVSLHIGLKTEDGNFIETELTATPVVDFEGNIESFVIIGKFEKHTSGEVEIKEVIKEVIVEKPVMSSAAETKQLESVFLSGVFHEILTPMNVILGFAQELTEGIENLTPDQKEAVEIINQNRGKLLSTMNAIIEFSEIQRNKDEWNIINLNITKVVEEIDKDIYEITGSRDINFAYGKISSSLQFEADKQKFDCLINNLIRLVCWMIKGNKIYFSAYQVDKNNFMIMISDSYASTSDYLADTLRKLFVDKKDPKEFGVSKLNAQITQSLLDMLQVKFVSSVDEMGKHESGFLFPIKFTPQLKEPLDKIEEEIVEGTEDQQMPVVAEEEVVQQEIPLPEVQGIVIEETQISEPTEITEQEEIIEQEKSEQIQEEFEVSESFPEKVIEPQKEVEFETKEELTFKEVVKQQFQQPDDKLDLNHLTCLYIEDQVDSQILFRVQMKGLKDIKYAVSFEEALPLLDTEQFDFIVMDINLQGEYNGLDALKIIHKMPGYGDIPIIAVTAYVLPGDKEKFIATGFNDFISKPIFREKMIESLEKIFLQKA